MAGSRFVVVSGGKAFTCTRSAVANILKAIASGNALDFEALSKVEGAKEQGDILDLSTVTQANALDNLVKLVE